MRPTGLIIGVVIIIACLVFSAKLFKSSLINYVPFAEAREATGQTVQIMGAPAAGTMAYDSNEHALHFALLDESGQRMPVVFKGPKPDDLDTAMTKATKITAQGSYSPSTATFVAENLLVKCPSKYKGSNDNGERSYGKA
jgi:cytochrome c-type biogenesis protein CcmE